ncbi:hypothetical protein CYMTET_33850 [Cymbomonas tetramitiformis]|uniref:Secreted protein n=1 Tax=Cymbomonas tetramitiformis TaxID=36881 RepID=A0AAE0FCA4_9CHLO|nr:hypothetical protein CYMTET_33850 [Cymbomonas tetramitiformis]
MCCSHQRRCQRFFISCPRQGFGLLLAVLTQLVSVVKPHANDVCTLWNPDGTAAALFVRTWHAYTYQTTEGHCNPLSDCPMRIVKQSDGTEYWVQGTSVRILSFSRRL